MGLLMTALVDETDESGEDGLACGLLRQASMALTSADIGRRHTGLAQLNAFLFDHAPDDEATADNRQGSRERAVVAGGAVIQTPPEATPGSPISPGISFDPNETQCRLEGLEQEIAQLEDGTYSDLFLTSGLLVRYEETLRKREEELRPLGEQIPEVVRQQILVAARNQRRFRPTELCDLAPHVAGMCLYPFLASVQALEKGARELDLTRQSHARRREERLKPLRQRREELRAALSAWQEKEFESILTNVLVPLAGTTLSMDLWDSNACSLRTMRDLFAPFPMSVWVEVEASLRARCYLFATGEHDLLCRAERFFDDECAWWVTQRRDTTAAYVDYLSSVLAAGTPMRLGIRSEFSLSWWRQSRLTLPGGRSGSGMMIGSGSAPRRQTRSKHTGCTSRSGFLAYTGQRRNRRSGGWSDSKTIPTGRRQQRRGHWRHWGVILMLGLRDSMSAKRWKKWLGLSLSRNTRWMGTAITLIHTRTVRMLRKPGLGWRTSYGAFFSATFRTSHSGRSISAIAQADNRKRMPGEKLSGGTPSLA